jgi:hypothetical protein
MSTQANFWQKQCFLSDRKRWGRGGGFYVLFSTKIYIFDNFHKCQRKRPHFH